MAHTLPLIWASILAFAVFAYVVLDGFDLGVGILFPYVRGEANRDLMMNTVAPIWDGNETWLVLGGGGLLATFPLAYSIVLSALYAPIICMLLGLILRGVAFEFRWRTRRGQFAWDWAFAVGSTVAAFAQGIALGAIIQGIPIANRAYAGGWWDWVTPFSILTGVALVFGYALLGATWLILKTEGQVADRAYELAWAAGAVTLLLIGVVSIWTPFLDPIFMQHWFALPAVFYAAWVPILVLLSAYMLFRGLWNRNDLLPFPAALCLFGLSYIGLGISFFPYIIPTTLTIWQAAAPASSLRFLLGGGAVLIPIILIYTGNSYWVFRGKIDPHGGYHH
jgi:cytochrome bd ubiquinol oxidase subunit II